MVNWKNSNHLMESDNSVLGIGTGTVVKSTRGLGFNSNHDEPHVVPEEGNDDSGTGPAPSTPDSGNTTQNPDNSGTSPAPADSTTTPAPSGTGSSPSEPTNGGTGQDTNTNTAGETDIPSNGGSGTGNGNSGDGSNYYDDHDSVNDNFDDDHSSSGNSGTETGNTALNGTSPSSSSNDGNTEADQSPTSNSNNMGKTKEGPPSVISQRERGKAALLSRLDIEDFIKFEPQGMKGDIIRKYNHMKNYSSPIVAIDERGNYIEKNDFNVDGMDISIKREHDGYGNKFDSVRTIETVKLANGQVVKCNIQDMVGANAESKAFADKHKGMTLPDGKYYFTAEDLTEQADGTYNSACFQNTLRLQTKDTNIPEHIRKDINSKYFLFHATEYKEGFIPKDGKCRIWIDPWSAGCISSITGGQSTHDDFMNMLTGITPENISVTITSKRHVDI